MILTNWKWCSSNEIPSLNNLKNTATFLLYKLFDTDKENTCLGSGGFNAYKFEYGIKLSFEPFYSKNY